MGEERKTEEKKDSLHLLLFLKAEPEAMGKDWDTDLSVPQTDLQN